MNLRATTVVAAFVFTVSACSGSVARTEVLGSIADDAIQPVLIELASTTSTLADSADSLCSTPTGELLDATRSALVDARSAWAVSEPMWIGPVMERRSWAVVDWPIAAEEIESLIADESTELTVDLLRARVGADQRGLGAVEYLLGNPDAGSTTVAALGDLRRCEYLTGIIEVIRAEAAFLPNDWVVDFEAAGPYRSTFVAEADSLDDLVNDVVFLVEAMADAELGTALGEMGSTADPAAVGEGAAGLGVVELTGHLRGLRLVLVGEDGQSGISPLLSDDLVQRITGSLDSADAGLAQLDGTLTDAVVDDPATVSGVRAAIKDLQIFLLTDVVSQLGVTIGFSDADGDTG